mmetsp:Transcript_12727/g.12585  ORF Transcript_12727/g.12585 Transcript_12727/m.12585 type:complete len:89 (-) Transcript_12727:252-518(-)
MFKEVKEYMIPVKYERDNDFVDVVYVQDSIFVTVSTQNNFFIVEGGQVKYYINITFNVKNSLRNFSPTTNQVDGDQNQDKQDDDEANA